MSGKAKEVNEFGRFEALRLVVLAADGRLTDEEIDNAFGRLQFRSYTEAAKAFGVSVSTVRHTWKPNGMPSIGRRGSGSDINGAEVLKWWRKRNSDNESARGKNEHTERKRDAETRAAEAEARIKERKAEVSEGQYTPTAVAVSVVRGCANWFRDGLMGVARKLEPIFPARDAKKYVAEVEREHRNLLVAFEETAINDLRAAADKAYEQ
jgi:hypothetical protein